MVSRVRLAILAAGLSLVHAQAGSFNTKKAADSISWNARGAETYLEQRQEWWRSWANSQRDHQTFCVSCHTVVPFALARPALQAALGETQASKNQQLLLDNVRKRVQHWDEMEPYYSDAKSGAGKAAESRSTESVLNAFLLASHDHRTGRLDSSTRKAFDSAWKLQYTSGPQAGAWNWQVFKLAPWESSESQYQGAALMAIAAGAAPGHYLKTKAIQENLARLRAYLHRGLADQPVYNKMLTLWAASGWKDLLTRTERAQIISEISTHQHADGGWSLAELGTWKRKDGSAADTQSDGYATGIAVLVLEEAGLQRRHAAVQRGRAWLIQNQDKADGSWHTASLNKQRDPKSNIGRFMSDAATGFAVLALEGGK